MLSTEQLKVRTWRLLPARVRHGISARVGPRDNDKYDWEFEWQRRYWLKLWLQPSTQQRCLEYWNRYRHLDEIRALVPIEESTHLLDIGCGLSSVLHYLPGDRVGIDPLADRYKTVYEYPFEVKGEIGESLSFDDSSFEVAFSSNVLDHVNDPQRLLAEVHRVLRPDGWFVLTCEVFDDEELERNPAHPHSLTAQRLRSLVSEQGFRVIQEWSEPWYGLRNYSLGRPPTDHREEILILRSRQSVAA